MFNFALVLPAGTAVVSILQIFIFVFLILIVPGSLSATMLSYIGFRKKQGVSVFSLKSFFKKALDFTLYHSAMLLVWLMSWPQIYNDIHTGYSLRGIGPYLGVMVLWTLLGSYLILAYRIITGVESYPPRIGMVVRLFFWNLFTMFIFRQLIYYFVTR